MRAITKYISYRDLLLCLIGISLSYFAVIYAWLGYKVISFVMRKADAANLSFSFGVFCSVSLMAIGWLIKLG